MMKDAPGLQHGGAEGVAVVGGDGGAVAAGADEAVPEAVARLPALQPRQRRVGGPR